MANFPKHFATQPSGFDMCVKVNDDKRKEIMPTTNFLCTKTLAPQFPPNAKHVVSQHFH